MESRVEQLNQEVGHLKVNVTELNKDVGTLKEWVLEMKESLNNLAGGARGVTESRANTQGVTPVEETSGSSAAMEKGGMKYRKLELPLFYGEDPIGWLFRVERYFHVNGISEEEKLEAAVVCLEGKALNWYQWLDSRNPIRGWLDFRREMLRRFHHSQNGDGYEMLMAMKQEGSVLEFIEAFELMSALLRNAPEEVLTGAFKNGLKEEVRAEIRMVHTATLQELMELALRVEEKNSILDRVHKWGKAQRGPAANRWGEFKPGLTRVTQSPETSKTMPVYSFDGPKRSDSKAESKANSNSINTSSIRREPSY